MRRRGQRYHRHDKNHHHPHKNYDDKDDSRDKNDGLLGRIMMIGRNHDDRRILKNKYIQADDYKIFFNILIRDDVDDDTFDQR